MNRQSIIIIVLAFFAFIDLSANNHKEKVASGVMVSYNYHYFTVSGYEVERPMILITNCRQSKFYNPVTNWIDSCNSTPEGKAAYLASQPKIITQETILSTPNRWEKMYVSKDFDKKILRRFDTIASERFYYEESLGNIHWELCDSVKTVLGYECQMARCDFRGREWEVWFAPDIPLSDGPWKLEGLPGLILEAVENVGQYKFTAIGVELYDGDIPPVYESDLYECLDRKEMLRHKRFVAENLGMIITAQTNEKKLKPSQLKALEMKADLDFLETDYHE